MFFSLPRTFSLFALLLGSQLCGCNSLETNPTPSAGLKVYFVNVGQGDACVMETPSHHFFLYDVGNQDTTLLDFLKKVGADSIDAVFISHPDLDHFGALESLFKKIPIQKIYLPAENRKDGAYQSLKVALKNFPGLRPSLFAGDTLFLGGQARLRVLWPYSLADFSGNNLSLVLRIEYAGKSILLTGDVEDEGEMGIVESGTNLRADILKVAHHGSRTSNGLPFLEKVQPKWASISCDSEVYGHPHVEAVADLKYVMGDSVNILRTDRVGTIAFELDKSGVRRFLLKP